MHPVSATHARQRTTKVPARDTSLTPPALLLAVVPRAHSAPRRAMRATDASRALLASIPTACVRHSAAVRRRWWLQMHLASALHAALTSPSNPVLAECPAGGYCPLGGAASVRMTFEPCRASASPPNLTAAGADLMAAQSALISTLSRRQLPGHSTRHAEHPRSALAATAPPAQPTQSLAALTRARAASACRAAWRAHQVKGHARFVSREHISRRPARRHVARVQSAPFV